MSSTDKATSRQEHRQAMQNCSVSTRAMHADDPLNSVVDVAPPMHVSTTFRYEEDPAKLKPVAEWDAFKDPEKPPTDAYIYSRYTAPNTNRLEAILSFLMNARTLTYSSGLSAFHALLVYLNPKRIAIGEGYHGCHGVIKVIAKLTGLQKVDLHSDDAAWDAAGLGEGDIVHVETPLNPTGEAYNLAEYARRAHARGAILTVDSTFGPPGLQDPFKQGTDVVMHSGTKYIGGHSDMLCGVLAMQRLDWWWGMFTERLFLGSVMGSFEGWLGMRSLRTLELRVQRQSETTTKLVSWLNAAMKGSAAPGSSVPSAEDAQVVKRTVMNLTHASLQAETEPWVREQMPGGFGPVFSLSLKSAQAAKELPSKLMLFHHATSLGGVESLIEWRRMSDDGVDERLLRVSIGIEAAEDLWNDLVQGLRALDGIEQKL